jgi:hypothetical protein
MTRVSASAVDSAWQAALAAEHQAVFGYGVLGPHLTGTDQRLAVACSDAHESLRDSTVSAMAGAGLRPVPSQADYPALYPVAAAAAARSLAIRLEDDAAAAWRYLYLQAASTHGNHARALRGLAQKALTASAVRATQWQAIVSPAHATTPFPGI